MKKLILVAIVVLFSTTTFAQSLDLGLKAGVNFANINDVSGDLDGRTGFVVGAFVGGKFNDKIGMQADLLYSQQGADFDIDKIDLNYVNVPVVIKYFLVKGLHIHAGPQFGFNINAKQELEVTGGDTDGDFEITGEDDIKDEVSGFDLGIGGGLAYQLDNGLFFQGRYIYGLSNVPEDVDDAQGEDVEDDLVNSVLSLSVGFKF